jgi:hypothetical protein
MITTITINDLYKNNLTGYTYTVYDITGIGKGATPSTETIVWLRLNPFKSWLFGMRAAQQYIAMPLRKLNEEFTNVKPV